MGRIHCLLKETSLCNKKQEEECPVVQDGNCGMAQCSLLSPSGAKILEDKREGRPLPFFHLTRAQKCQPIHSVSILAGMAAAPIGVDQFQEGLEWALRFLCNTLGADDGEILFSDPEGAELILSASVGPDQNAIYEKVRFRVGYGYPGIAFAEQRLMASANLEQDRLFLRKSLVRRGIRTFLSVPILGSAGKPLGCLGLAWRRNDLSLSRLGETLRVAMHPLANAIDASFLGFRRRIFQDGPDVPDFLHATLNALLQTSGAGSGRIVSWDTRSGRAVGGASMGRGGSLPSCPVLSAFDRGVPPSPCEIGHGKTSVLCHKAKFDGSAVCCIPLERDVWTKGVAVLGFHEKTSRHPIQKLIPLHLVAKEAETKWARVSGGERQIESRPPRLEIKCFGRFELRLEGKLIPPKAFLRRRALKFLKILVLKSGHPIHREQLIDLLWPDDEEESVRLNRLYGVIHSLRSVLEPEHKRQNCAFILSEGESYLFDCGAGASVDVVRFRELLVMANKARRSGEKSAMKHLADAVELYRGNLFEDEPYAEWCQAERLELQESYIGALKELAEQEVIAGDLSCAIGTYQRAAKADPFREDLQIDLVALLVKTGRKQEALAHCEKFLREFKEELGAVPGHRFQRLYQDLLAWRKT